MHTCVGFCSKYSILTLSSLHIDQESFSFQKDPPAALNWMEDAVTSVSQIQMGIDVFVLKECSLRVTMPLLAKEVNKLFFFFKLRVIHQIYLMYIRLTRLWFTLRLTPMTSPSCIVLTLNASSEVYYILLTIRIPWNQNVFFQFFVIFFFIK